MSAELAVRRTAAAAVVADFDREANAYIAGTGEVPDWSAWAWRLRTELVLVLDRLADEQPGTLEQLGVDAVLRQLAAIRAVFDVFDWETDDRQYALEQIEDILRSQS